MSLTTLNNNLLSITIAEPGSLYKGSRFDWTGHITEIIYNNEFTFTVPESLDPKMGTGGSGFCNEFGIEQVIGYDASRPGQQFPKIGVGLLTGDKAPYFFAKPYAIEAITYEVVYTSNLAYEVHARFSSDTDYDCLLKKRIEIAGSDLTITYTLINNGNKEISTDDYNHNFIGINKALIGLDYELDLPIANSFKLEAGQCQINGQSLTWASAPTEDFYLKVALKDSKSPYNWNLFHKKLGVGVKECSSFPISKCAVWGSGHVVSPELFFQVDLKPSDSVTWERKYCFYQ